METATQHNLLIFQKRQCEAQKDKGKVADVGGPTVLTNSVQCPQEGPDPHRVSARSKFPRKKLSITWSSREFGIRMMKDHKVTRELGLGEKSYCMSVKGDAAQAQTCVS